MNKLIDPKEYKKLEPHLVGVISDAHDKNISEFITKLIDHHTHKLHKQIDTLKRGLDCATNILASSNDPIDLNDKTKDVYLLISRRIVSTLPIVVALAPDGSIEKLAPSQKEFYIECFKYICEKREIFKDSSYGLTEWAIGNGYYDYIQEILKVYLSDKDGQ